mmetsp:Transcript_41558/g.104434  ORF Transcript_41558/g.104434 Transcript_41558/m.104434 type:complete len:367 (+) Transcript_41558:885-1985(+)
MVREKMSCRILHEHWAPLPVEPMVKRRGAEVFGVDGVDLQRRLRCEVGRALLHRNRLAREAAEDRQEPLGDQRETIVGRQQLPQRRDARRIVAVQHHFAAPTHLLVARRLVRMGSALALQLNDLTKERLADRLDDLLLVQPEVIGLQKDDAILWEGVAEGCEHACVVAAVEQQRTLIGLVVRGEEPLYVGIDAALVRMPLLGHEIKLRLEAGHGISKHEDECEVRQLLLRVECLDLGDGPALNDRCERRPVEYARAVRCAGRERLQQPFPWKLNPKVVLRVVRPSPWYHLLLEPPAAEEAVLLSAPEGDAWVPGERPRERRRSGLHEASKEHRRQRAPGAFVAEKAVRQWSAHHNRRRQEKLQQQR